MNAAQYYRTQLTVRGTKIPELRKQARDYPLWTPREARSAAAFFVKSRSFEARYVHLFRLANWAESANPQVAAQILWNGKWINGIENWAHSDTFSSILSRVLDRHPSPGFLYAKMRKWMRVSNPWFRRQALVPLFYFSSTRTQYPSWPQVRETLKALHLDSDFYVQRAVGWCLRESFQIYPQQTKQLLKTHLIKWSSIAFTTAVEKQKSSDRQRWKLERSRMRIESSKKSG